MLWFLWEEEIWNHELSAGANNFADLSFLFIYSISLLLSLGGRCGKQWRTTTRFPDGRQFVFQVSQWCDFSQGTGLRLCLDMSLLSAAATRQVILGYKFVYEVARRVLSPGKGIAFTGRKIVASSAKTSRSGANVAKSFRSAGQMLNTQSFISSPLSTLPIKVRVCENRSCK